MYESAPSVTIQGTFHEWRRTGLVGTFLSAPGPALGDEDEADRTFNQHLLKNSGAMIVIAFHEGYTSLPDRLCNSADVPYHNRQ